MSGSLRALLFVPGLMGCALVAGGFASGSDPMLWIGFGLAGLALVILLGLKVSDVSAEAAERRRILKSGRQATAQVISITEAPGGGDGIPEVDLELEVRVEGAPPVTAKVRSLISRLAVPRIQPGCEIQVWVDSAGGKGIVLDPQLTPYRTEGGR